MGQSRPANNDGLKLLDPWTHHSISYRALEFDSTSLKKNPNYFI
jgi:hypothetical protein